MKTNIYPLQFQPIIKEKIWGSESWQICDIDTDSSIVTNGFLADNSINEVIETYLGEITGDNKLQYYGQALPILIKKLQVDQYLSLQIHPSDEIALERHNSLGKAEFWYILDAKPTAKIYLGLKEEMTATEFYNRCQDDTLEEVLKSYTPKKGECYYIEPGTIHAVGGGVTLIEIQQPSDITYRIYDWGRERNAETRREMHLDMAIDSIDYKPYDEVNNKFDNIKSSNHLIDNNHFTINSIALKDKEHIYTDNYNSFIVYICATGTAEIETIDGKKELLTAGNSMLIPAGMDSLYIAPKENDTVLLEVYLKDIAEDEDEYLNYTEEK